MAQIYTVLDFIFMSRREDLVTVQVHAFFSVTEVDRQQI